MTDACGNAPDPAGYGTVVHLWSASSKQILEFKQSWDAATVKSTVVCVTQGPLCLTNGQQKTKYRQRALWIFLRA